MIENKTRYYIDNFRDAKLKTKAIILILLFIALLAVNSTEVYLSTLTPFGIAMVFALLGIGFNGYILSAEFFLSYMLSKFSVEALVVSLNVSIVLAFIEYLSQVLKTKNKKLKNYQLVLLYLVSMIGYVFVSVGTLKENLSLSISIVLSFIFLYVCLRFCSSLFTRGIWVGLNLDDKICGATIYIVFMLGALNLSIYYFNLAIVILPIVILVSTFVFKLDYVLIMSVLSGVAVSLYYLEPLYISMTVLLGIVSIAFKSKYKVISVLSIEFAYIMFILLFNIGFSLTEIVSFTFGVLVFVLLPRKLLDTLGALMSRSLFKDETAVLDRVKGQMETRLKNLSLVFDDMHNTYMDMVRGVLDDDKAIDLLKSELVRTVCDGCSEKNNCYRLTGSFIENSLDVVVSNGYARGKVLLTDIPGYLTTNCCQVNKLILELNSLLSNYKEYVNAVSNVDSSRVIIAEQLLAVSTLLDGLSKEVSTVINFDSRLEGRLVEELRLVGIVCIKAIVYQKDISVKEIIVIVSKETYNDKKIEKYVSKITASNMRIVKVGDSSVTGAVVATLVSSPQYDIVFGSSVISKNGKVVCGDSCNITPIDYGKYLVSISDGMGSGSKANSISALTTKLVENFYRAGFDSDVILRTINELLSLSEEENYATIDLCIIDGRNCTYDFIKLASVNGYIIHERGECEVVEGSNLPIGILDNIKPHITRRLISNMDIIVMMSDGVSDALSSIKIKDFLRSLDIINPQTLCDTIMEKALSETDGVAKDDMSVIAIRVFEAN